MKKKKSFLLVVCIITMAVLMVGCSGNLLFYDQLDENRQYNRELFYQNDLTEKAADPSVIYITEGEDAGYYYMYGTSDQIGATGYQSWKSKDLSTWQCTGVAFVPDRDAWARQNYWAPEVIYYKTPEQKENNEAGKYYMFYNAWNVNKNYRHCVGLAVADSPNGPFVQYTGTNSDGRKVELSDEFLNTDLFSDSDYLRGKPIIDASPFVDDNGDIYLYYTLDIQFGETNSSIWGMKMKDMFTPDYTSSKQITLFNKQTIDPTSKDMGEDSKTNEAPFVYRKGDRYYMTFSISQYFNPAYSVAQAVSNNPLEGFKKIEHSKGGRLLTAMSNDTADYDEEVYDHMTGTGHHSFIKVGDELFIAYHAFVDRAGTIADGRAIAVDRVFFANNGEEEIIYVNGPSYSLQPLPFETSGYKNVALNAKISSKEASSEDSIKFLNDGIYKNHNYDFINEFSANGTKATITINLDKAYQVSAIMIYNSFKYDESFAQIDSIKLSSKNNAGDSKKGSWEIKGLKFLDRYIFEDRNDPDFKIMRPGGSAIAEFNNLAVDTIVITVKAQDKATKLSISDIVVLGK